MKLKTATLTTVLTAGIIASTFYFGSDNGDPIITNGKNNKYSFASFKRQSLVNVPVKEFDSSEIIGGSFYQDVPYSKVFPDSIKGVKFIRCNLDNCIIPEGAVVIGGTNKHYKIQNDQEYWIVNKSLQPVIPRDTSNFRVSGVSISPDSIPNKPLAEPITITRNPETIQNRKLQEIMNDEQRLIAALKKAGQL